MRSAAAAIAWEFRQRHRWGLIALTGYLLVLATIRLLILGAGQRVNFDNPESFALVVVVPLTSTFMYFLAVFSFGLAGDLAARTSMYPARMFTLPVTTAALAGWPMLDGTVAMVILWLATRLLAVWPSGVDVPMVWPALLAAALLAWTQALTWMPYALPGLRVVVTVLWLAVIDAVVLVALHYKAPEGVMLAILAPHIPLAYLVARFAVGRARRGDVPDWSGLFHRLGHIADVLPRRQDHFASPARAQVWFEWRRHGRSLPALVGILLPFELALLFVFSDTPAIVIEMIFLALFTPPFMAAFVAATVSRSNPHGSDSYAMTPFLATRPLSSTSLIAAKMKATIRSTLAAWLLVLVAIPLALRLSGTSAVVIERAHEVVEVFGMPRAVAIALLGFLALLASTWKQLVQSLYVGLSGREWVVKASVFGALSLLAIIGPLAHWISRDREAQVVLWNAIPWIAAVLVCIKLSAAAWIAVRLHDSRLIPDRTLVIGVVCWDVSVLALYGLLTWIFSTLLIRSYFLALVATLRGAAGARPESASVTAWPREDDVEEQEESHRHGSDFHRPAGGVGPVRGSLVLRTESLQWLPHLLGREAEVPALCPEHLRPFQADATRHQHARSGGMAGSAKGGERVEPPGREPGAHCRLPVGVRRRGTADLARGPRGRSHAGCSVHLRVDRQVGKNLQHRPGEDLCERTLQRRRDVVRPLVHAVSSNRGGRAGRGCANITVELVHGPSTRADDCVSRDRRSGHSVQRRPVVDLSRIVSRCPEMGGEVGSKKPLRIDPGRIDGRC
jgi:hypothetical protein